MISEKIRAIWIRELGTEKFSDDDNFFDLGGDSVLMYQVQDGITEEFGVELPMDELFRWPTVAGLSAHIASLKTSS